MGIVTTSSETAFTQSATRIFDFVTDPVIWTKTYRLVPASRRTAIHVIAVH